MIYPEIINPATGALTNRLYQWDTNVKMEVEFQNVTKAEAVFSHKDSTSGIRKELVKSGDKWGCIIPDEVLQNGSDVSVFFTCTTDGRKTFDKAVVKVIRQVQPTDYISTSQPEYIPLTGLIEEVRALKTDCEAIKEEILSHDYASAAECENYMKGVLTNGD